MSRRRQPRTHRCWHGSHCQAARKVVQLWSSQSDPVEGTTDSISPHSRIAFANTAKAFLRFGSRRFWRPSTFTFGTASRMHEWVLPSMLEDGSTQSIVCWGSKRDCFVVKNINEFSRTILPQVFNHSNFPSFVRQLNKYDFHKVKQTEFNQPGEQTSTAIGQMIFKR
ncbi:hypothetical protein GALMADRAFT_439371 [Galerina marginata CBS 339.88]|uniref:HSF-type DNA-binding domain-containing protein n=1 Tax=Galerina marginata (strain CBS 339.88) TaxID=685588 RepID=A0A067T265_GALM3|nr:hypothetical protein GALMADRAFT_439371 [Galerina marginata CBS 339.88]